MRIPPIALAWLIAVSLTYAQEAPASLRLTPKRLTNIKDAYPLLSPDGSKILFESDRTGNWEIYVMNPDGKDVVQLTNNTAPDQTPSWSPDGRKIVFASERDNDSESTS